MMSKTHSTLSHGAYSITLKGPDYGSDDELAKRQVVGQTAGDQLFVYCRGRSRVTLHLQFNNLDAQERGDLEAFLDEVEYARRWWNIDLPAPVRATVLVSGAEIDGDPVLAGDCLAGQAVIQDLLRYRVRLLSASVVIAELSEAHYNATLLVRVLGTFVPSNVC